MAKVLTPKQVKSVVKTGNLPQEDIQKTRKAILKEAGNASGIWDATECDVCHKLVSENDVQVLHIESLVCNNCIKKYTKRQLAKELTKSVKPSTVKEILEDLEVQLASFCDVKAVNAYNKKQQSEGKLGLSKAIGSPD